MLNIYQPTSRLYLSVLCSANAIYGRFESTGKAKLIIYKILLRNPHLY